MTLHCQPVKFLQVYKWMKNVQHLLQDQRCFLCHQTYNGLICFYCEKLMPWFKAIQSCPKCGLPVPDGNICGNCQQQNWYFDSFSGLFYYQFPIDKLISNIKFNCGLADAKFLSELWSAYFKYYSDITKPDAIIPMPLHIKRLRQRGFNQAIELFRPIAKKMKVPIDNKLAIRTKQTKPQAELSAKERQANMAKAFIVNNNQYKHVVICDDVMTTGNTLNSLAKSLKQSGIKIVDVWCMARTIR